MCPALSKASLNAEVDMNLASRLDSNMNRTSAYAREKTNLTAIAVVVVGGRGGVGGGGCWLRWKDKGGGGGMASVLI